MVPKRILQRSIIFNKICKYGDWYRKCYDMGRAVRGKKIPDPPLESVTPPRDAVLPDSKLVIPTTDSPDFRRVKSCLYHFQGCCITKPDAVILSPSASSGQAPRRIGFSLRSAIRCGKSGIFGPRQAGARRMTSSAATTLYINGETALCSRWPTYGRKKRRALVNRAGVSARLVTGMFLWTNRAPNRFQ